VDFFAILDMATHSIDERFTELWYTSLLGFLYDIRSLKERPAQYNFIFSYDSVTKQKQY